MDPTDRSRAARRVAPAASTVKAAHQYIYARQTEKSKLAGAGSRTRDSEIYTHTTDFLVPLEFRPGKMATNFRKIITLIFSRNVTQKRDNNLSDVPFLTYYAKNDRPTVGPNFNFD